MNRKGILILAGAGFIAAALLIGTLGAAWAQTTPGPERPNPGSHPHGLMQQHGGQGAMAARHAEAQAAVAQALGITVEELQTELQTGKAIPRIAQEQGVDLAAVHAAVQAAHGATGRHGRGLMGGAMQPGINCPLPSDSDTGA